MPLERQHDILVVDDTPANLRLLVDMLGGHGFKVRPATSGAMAVKAVVSSPPDLILLDITMPEMNGYEVCAELKKDPANKDIPILFISALNETIDKVKAFSSGGVDYITKPFQVEEVLARVKTHLRLSELRLELERMNNNLEELVEKRTAEKETIEADLRVAGEIQKSLLPDKLPPGDSPCPLDIAAFMRPAKTIGGDFYDFFHLSGGRVFLAIGDVSGKGAPAALFMAIAKTLIKDKMLEAPIVNQALANANNSLHRDNDACMFATVFCGIADHAKQNFEYCCAGHNPPIIKSGTAASRFLETDPGIAIGPFPAVPEAFPVKTAEFAPGDTIILYSDGVTEAMNRENQLFSSQKLIHAVDKQHNGSAADIVAAILQSISEHAGEEPQSDDVTILVVKYKT